MLDTDVSKTLLQNLNIAMCSLCDNRLLINKKSYISLFLQFSIMVIINMIMICQVVKKVL